MESRHTVATATVLSVLAIAVVAAVGVGVSPAVLAQADNETTDNETSFGAQMSAFAQATAADANATVDSGMWTQRVNASENPGQAVRARATDLQQRLDALQNRTEHLEAARANGTITGVAYTARASAVHAELANLRHQVNETSQVAERVGVNTTKLDDLRTAAGNATGPEIAAIARNITDAGQGPPPWAGDGGQGTQGGADDNPGNGSAGPPDDAGPPDNESGPPDNGSGQSGNESGGGPNQGGGSDGNSGTGPEDGSRGPGTGPNRQLVDLVRVW